MLETEKDSYENNSDWRQFVDLMEANPQFIMRVLDMDACMVGKVCSVYTVDENFLIDVIEAGVGPGHARGYLASKTSDLREGSAWGLRGRDGQGPVRVWVGRVVENLKNHKWMSRGWWRV